MKRIVKIALTSFAVFSLISCVDNQTSNSNSDSSSVPIQDVYHHVTFLNDDETLLYEVDVLEGNEAVYGGETPTKAEDDEFTYEFQGWDKEDELRQITEDVTTFATYKSIAKEDWGIIIK